MGRSFRHAAVCVCSVCMLWNKASASFTLLEWPSKGLNPEPGELLQELILTFRPKHLDKMRDDDFIWQSSCSPKQPAHTFTWWGWAYAVRSGVAESSATPATNCTLIQGFSQGAQQRCTFVPDQGLPAAHYCFNLFIFTCQAMGTSSLISALLPSVTKGSI